MTEQGDSATTFAKIDVVAGPERAAEIRQEFGEWLRRYFVLDPEKSSDVLLAVYEALANAAEFAYAGADEPGVMHMRADYDDASSVLTVTVIDKGSWLHKDEAAKTVARGRGIPLMHALTDRAEIDTTADGTSVRLQWDRIDQS